MGRDGCSQDLEQTVGKFDRKLLLSVQLPRFALQDSVQAIEIIKNSLDSPLYWVELGSCKSLMEVRN